MALWRLVLVLVGLSFVGFGFAFIFRVEELGAVVSLVLNDATSRTDVRAVYGGMQFGIGIFILLCAVQREYVRVGLFAAACVFAGTATARFVGLLTDGFGQYLMLLFLAIEVAAGALTTWGALVATPDLDMLPPPIQDPTPDSDHAPL